MNLEKHIILCGFMASGKTTVGRLLSQKLNVGFIDTDEYIMSEHKMRIPEIFSKYGEQYFRDLEYEAVVKISKLSPRIISTGGGVLTFDRNGEILKESGHIILLNRNFDTVYNKIFMDKNRPLARGKTKEALFDLYAGRINQYHKYSHFIAENNQKPEDCVNDILCKLGFEI